MSDPPAYARRSRIPLLRGGISVVFDPRTRGGDPLFAGGGTRELILSWVSLLSFAGRREQLPSQMCNVLGIRGDDHLSFLKVWSGHLLFLLVFQAHSMLRKISLCCFEAYKQS